MLKLADWKEWELSMLVSCGVVEFTQLRCQIVWMKVDMVRYAPCQHIIKWHFEAFEQQLVKVSPHGIYARGHRRHNGVKKLYSMYLKCTHSLRRPSEECHLIPRSKMHSRSSSRLPGLLSLKNPWQNIYWLDPWPTTKRAQRQRKRQLSRVSRIKLE